MDLWHSFVEWFMQLGENYGVNPLIFGSIYVGAIPFFSVSIGWLMKNYKKKKPITLPLLTAGFFFISAYLYLFIAGKNIPVWVYVFLLAMIAYGVFATVLKVRKKVKQPPSE